MLGAAALGTAMVIERRVVAEVLSDGLDTTTRFGRTLAEATGLRRRPLYIRALPGAGIATGLVAAACAAYFVTSRRMASRDRFDPGPRTQRESSEHWTPLDPLEPPDPPPERPAGRGNPNDRV